MQCVYQHFVLLLTKCMFMYPFPLFNHSTATVANSDSVWYWQLLTTWHTAECFLGWVGWEWYPMSLSNNCSARLPNSSVRYSVTHSMVMCVVDLAWQSVLYGSYSTEHDECWRRRANGHTAYWTQGVQPQGWGLYMPYSMQLPCHTSQHVSGLGPDWTEYCRKLNMNRALSSLSVFTWPQGSTMTKIQSLLAGTVWDLSSLSQTATSAQQLPK